MSTDPKPEPFTDSDVYFLIGLAHGPYLNGLTELPAGLLDIAAKIGARLGDRGMVKRCNELRLNLQATRAATKAQR